MKKTVPPIPPQKTAWYLQHPEKFIFDKPEANVMLAGDGQPPYARIPQIKNRIRIENNEKVLLVIGQKTDEETGEIIEETVEIGGSISGYLPGMMLTKDVYFDYFDLGGNMIYDPLKQKDKAAQVSENESQDEEPTDIKPYDEDSEETTDETEKPSFKTLNNQDNPDNGHISDISDQSTALSFRSSEEELRRQVAEELQKKTGSNSEIRFWSDTQTLTTSAL